MYVYTAFSHSVKVNRDDSLVRILFVFYFFQQKIIKLIKSVKRLMIRTIFITFLQNIIYTVFSIDN